MFYFSKMNMIITNGCVPSIAQMTPWKLSFFEILEKPIPRPHVITHTVYLCNQLHDSRLETSIRPYTLLLVNGCLNDLFA